tara:strand:- start:85 stop:498 length:414 start_codon:yes stop_codon:yes gene_type:complete
MKNNALLLKPDRTLEVITIDNFQAIAPLTGAKYTEMIGMGKYPPSIPVELTDMDEHELKLVKFIVETVERGKSLLPQPKGEDYDFHRITDPSMVQMYIHEYGALIPLEKNQWFETTEIYGNVVVLGHCCDEFNTIGD